jgi:hypothetical protein
LEARRLALLDGRRLERKLAKERKQKEKEEKSNRI